MKNLNLKAIRIDGDTQARSEINSEVVAEYAALIKDGVTFPPVVVFFDGADNWLADGFHRFHGHTSAGKASIAADVRPGTQREAQLFSFGANFTHGLRRTNADKRKAVQAMLDDAEWCAWSDRKIADACGVTHPFVAAIRAPKVVTVTTPKANEVIPKAPVSDAPAKALKQVFTAPAANDSHELAEANEAIQSLSEELEEARAKLAIENMDASEEEKTEAANTIAELRAQVKTLTVELDAMRISRDGLQRTNAELMKQVSLNAKELKKARA